MKFVSRLTADEKAAALYLLDHYPRVWRAIHRELSYLIAPGHEKAALKAAARIVAIVGGVVRDAAQARSKQLLRDLRQ